MRKATANILFRLIILAFSAVLAVLTLLAGIDLTAGSERVNERRREIEALEKENEILRAQVECGMSLEELEAYAIGVLGMQHCEPGQVHTAELEG